MLPAAAVRLLLDMLAEVAAGNAVTVVPIYAELTTQQGAEVLGVSRPFLVGLLEEGKLPFHKSARTAASATASCWRTSARNTRHAGRCSTSWPVRVRSSASATDAAGGR